MYHFRAPFILDISKLETKKANQLTDGYSSDIRGYERLARCEYLSCHCADLSYIFEVEKQINCTAVSSHKSSVTLTLTLDYSWLTKRSIW